MRIHHLNCGSHCPVGGRFYDRHSTGLFADICTHCLLLELGEGLVLVDTGYGLADMPGRAPRRIARLWPLVLNPRLREADTALRQVEALGFSARDVRHVVLTHLDFDHAGGIEDFPEAAVHVLAEELATLEKVRRGFVGNQRYRPLQFDEVRDWHAYSPAGEPWFGFDAVRQLDGLPPEILMVPLRGHTLGHAGIAIQTSSGWLFDAGDAYLDRVQLTDNGRGMPPGLAIYDRIMMSDAKSARHNLQRLRDLHAANSDRIDIFCSHDHGELDTLAGR